MAKKYNFYDLKTKVLSGGLLPTDVNQFVKDYLTKKGRHNAVLTLNKKEASIQCGSITSFVAKNPLSRIEIKTNFGMVEGFDNIDEKIDESGECSIDKTHIKNPLLDMGKPEKENLIQILCSKFNCALGDLTKAIMSSSVIEEIRKQLNVNKTKGIQK